MIVRQSILYLMIATFLAVQATAAEPYAVEKARLELERVRELAAIGAVSKARLQQAEDKLEDARDEDTLSRLLYGRVGVEDLNETQARDLVAAAERRVERVAKQYQSQGWCAVRFVRAHSQAGAFQTASQMPPLHTSGAHP